MMDENTPLNKMDPAVRDKKSPAYSDASVYSAFLLRTFVYIPVTLLLLPFAAASQLCIAVGNAIWPPKTKLDVGETEDDQIFKQFSATASSRTHDLVLFGASGFTGRLAALYIARMYGNRKFKWAIAGRRKDALENLRSELASIDASLSTIPIVIADSNDISSLCKLVISTKVVLTTAGPFDKYGSNLVRCCAEFGTNYCDITGETDWVRKMIDKYDDKARETGAHIVHFCGHDCVPWDLIVYESAKKLRTMGDNIVEISCYDEINANASGGTLDTVFHSLGNRIKYKSRLGFDPLVKLSDGSKSNAIFKVKNQSLLGYSAQHRCWTGPFVMAMVMANCIRRSHCVNDYSPKLVYRESIVFPSWMAGWIYMVDLILLGVVIATPPLTSLLLAVGILPNPGQGPSEKNMDEGYLKVTAYASGENGNNKVKTEFYFPTDPGYRDTARMLVESGLVFVLNGGKVKVGGGVWTPAACIGECLTERLVATGSNFVME